VPKSLILPLFIFEGVMAQDLQASLDAVNAAIDAMVGGGAVSEYSINGRSIRKMSLKDLMDYRDRLQSEIASSRNVRTYAEFDDPDGNCGPGYPQPSGL
jgi:hypothetical protein